MERIELNIKSTVDGSLQPSIFFRCDGENRPLLIGLHTWSHNRENTVPALLPFAEKYNFNLLCPEFRGPNLTSNPICTEACGSILAKQDIKDAIDEVIRLYSIDVNNIFLFGMSGGGHMALLMAGFCPEYFKAIASGVPITDLSRWVEENEGYKNHVIACTGGDKDEMLARSPISYVDTIARANIKIFHGKWDPVVPVSHSIRLYSIIAEKYPTAKVYLDIFDGRHQKDMVTVMHWFLSQYKDSTVDAVTG